MSRTPNVASKPSGADAARAVFSRQRVDGFGFDVEVL